MIGVRLSKSDTADLENRTPKQSNNLIMKYLKGN